MSEYKGYYKEKHKKKVGIIIIAVFLTVALGTIIVMNKSVEILAAGQEENEKDTEISDLEEKGTEIFQSEEQDMDEENEDSSSDKEMTTETDVLEKGDFEENETIDKSKESEKDDETDNRVDVQSVIETEAMEISIPIYNYDIVNVVVPTSYAVALNPYELPVRVNDTIVSTSQVVARNYGIINKSTSDKIVTITLVVEDQNGGMITFVDSKEAVLNADEDTYAVYLAAVPADNSGVKLGNGSINKDTTAKDLADVFMTKAEGVVVLKEGKNQIAFKLSKAIYQYTDGKDIHLGSVKEQEIESMLELTNLAADGTGVTAFTFEGMMNKHADWTKLGNGIKVSVVYSYENAMGDEEIVDGTGAVVRLD